MVRLHPGEPMSDGAEPRRTRRWRAMGTEATYDDLLARTRALIGASADRVPVVGISGQGIRLFSDRTRDWFDLMAWVDMDADEAGSRAIARNLLQGDDAFEIALWGTKWIPEGHDYERLERPQERVDMVISAPR